MAELQRIERDTQKIMVENGAKHPQGSIELLYLPRSSGGGEGGGLNSVEAKYKITKIKAAVNVYGNTNPTMGLVWREGDPGWTAPSG